MSRSFFSAAVLTILLCAVSPPLALGAGILFGLLFTHPYAAESQRAARVLLQCSVVALGFGMNLGEVIHAGRASFAYTAVGISVAIVLGLTLGKLLRVRAKTSFLITIGTAICGGSAIAALAPITNPDEEELAISLGTVFVLNSAGLLLFPAIGLALHLTQTQFGLWAALAIHDTSSVVGAAAKFGPEALAIGTVVKLTRALWIIPVALVCALVYKSSARIRIPWFILLFCLAAAAKSWFAAGAPLFAAAVKGGRIGLALTLFLIGTGITVRTLRRAGSQVLVQGLALWIVVASLSLLAIQRGWIRL